MKRLPPLVERIVTGAGLVVMFGLMASVIVPDWTQAESVERDEWPSVDPHDGLASFGTFEGEQYVVHVFAGPEGPLYTIEDRATGEIVATLMDAERIHRSFPDLSLPLVDFSADATGPIMMADAPTR